MQLPASRNASARFKVAVGYPRAGPFPGASANLKGGLKPAELQAPYAALHGLLTATYHKSYIYSGISKNLQYEWVR